MTFSFGAKSLAQRETLHPKLQKIVDELIKHVNITIIEGVRTPERQKELLAQGVTKTLDSKHLPDANGKSRAMDIGLYPLDWSDRDKFVLFAGYVIGVAEVLGIKLVSGTDWDRDFHIKADGFFDGPHFQLDDNEI